MDIKQYLSELAIKLENTSHGQRGALLDEAQSLLNISRQTIYRQLKQLCGWSSKRKRRSDKGKTSLNEKSLLALAAMQRESVRENGKQTLFTTTARSILEQNGYQFCLSNTQLNRLLRQRRLNVKAQKALNPVQPLRALHPNHTHEIDPSLCLIYYLKGKQHIMRDSEFYKNKLKNYAKVQYKVWRYTLYDRASGMIIPWYVEAAGENQHSLFQFLMFAWGQQQGRVFHGVPQVLYWDKGSANSASAIKNLLDHLEVKHLSHAAGNARAKGGVENANNIVETQFESRLRFEPVQDIVALNQAALAWAAAYNANLLPGQDSRLKRVGLATPISRQQLWQKISPQQLRLLPSIAICKALMASKTQQRQVKPDLTISYKHPQAQHSLSYSVRGLAGVAVKDKVDIKALAYGKCAIQIQIPRYDGAPLIYQLEPLTGYDEFGQLLTAPIIGEAHQSPNDTEIEIAAKCLDAIAYPNLTQQAIKQARAKQSPPFNGELDTISYLEKVEHPLYFQPAGCTITPPEYTKTMTSSLSTTAAMMRISQAIGRNLTVEENRWLRHRYQAGVPEENLANIIDYLLYSLTGEAAIDAVEQQAS